MSQLQRVVQHFLVLATLDLGRVPRLACCLQLLLPDLQVSLEQVPPVSEGPHSVHIEGVLSLADGAGSGLLFSATNSLIGLTAVL